MPWKDIAGFRDKAVHDYFEIDLGVVWNTIIDDVPILKSKLQNILNIKKKRLFGELTTANLSPPPPK